jgi:hypothetical protein
MSILRKKLKQAPGGRASKRFFVGLLLSTLSTSKKHGMAEPKPTNPHERNQKSLPEYVVNLAHGRGRSVVAAVSSLSAGSQLGKTRAKSVLGADEEKCQVGRTRCPFLLGRTRAGRCSGASSAEQIGFHSASQIDDRTIELNDRDLRARRERYAHVGSGWRGELANSQHHTLFRDKDSKPGILHPRPRAICLVLHEQFDQPCWICSIH